MVCSIKPCFFNPIWFFPGWWKSQIWCSCSWNHEKNTGNVSDYDLQWISGKVSQAAVYQRRLCPGQDSSSGNKGKIKIMKKRLMAQFLWLWYSLNSQDKSDALGEPLASTSFARWQENCKEKSWQASKLFIIVQAIFQVEPGAKGEPPPHSQRCRAPETGVQHYHCILC